MKSKNWKLICVNAGCVAALFVVMVPLLLLAKYNYPSADDWSYGTYTYHVLQEDGNLIDVIKTAADRENYPWESRFSNGFFASLQPGIWGEEYYQLTTWIMIGGLIVAEILMFMTFFRTKTISAKWWGLPIVLITLLMQILCVPYPEETFYWYTGSMNYTFNFSMSLVLLTLFYRLGNKKMFKWKLVLLVIVAELLAIAVGGNNHATSLATFLALVLGSIMYFIHNKRGFIRTIFLTVTMGICLFFTITAPSNWVRMESEFSGNGMGAVESVAMSLVYSVTNTIAWTNLPMLLLVIWMIPFFWKITKDMEFKFKWPALFSIVSFGIYASQLTPALFASGGVDAKRMACVIYYSYYVWLISNVGYWVGWCTKKSELKFISYIQKYVLLWTIGVAGVAAVCLLVTTNLWQLSSYKAYNWLRNGYAEAYGKAWEERLEQLKNPDIKECYFEPLSCYNEMICYTDFFEGEHWVNIDCACYYDKEYVGLQKEE